MAIYLDHAAATPLDPKVFAAMQPYLDVEFYNPSATYLAARKVRKDIEAARGRIAWRLGARPAEVYFTAGGTDSTNLAIHGVMQQYPAGNLVVSSIEHDAVLKPASQYNCKIAPVKPNGIVDIDALTALIDDNTVLVSVMYANNEIGTVLPLRKISQVLETIREARLQQGNATPLIFHTDACQATPYLDLHVSRLGVDMMSVNASKMYGPKQVGALYVQAQITLRPLVLGGGQERSLRSGTENVAGVIGMATALDIVQDRRESEGKRLHDLQLLFCRLLDQRLPNASLNGTLKQRLPNNLHVTFPGIDNERLMMQLDEHGVQVAVGSACKASSEDPSHVLKAIGLSDDAAQSSLRMTMGRATTEADVRQLVDLLAQFATTS